MTELHFEWKASSDYAELSYSQHFIIDLSYFVINREVSAKYVSSTACVGCTECDNAKEQPIDEESTHY